MDKIKAGTLDTKGFLVEKLGGVIPQVVTEKRDENGEIKKAIDFEKLKALLEEQDEIVEPGEEHYEFTWVGKKEAMIEANRPINKTLRPCKEESKDWDKTENLYIEGDNLEVLKLLQESYLNSVKMIYIDPPYNTGNDFIYKDDFKMTSEEYKEESGEIDEEGNRLFKNTETNGRFHSDWCSMMYSRLMLARNLLSDDGVIFISIDDNEVDNLKKICDEIFGERNFVTNFTRVTKKGGKSSDSIAKNNDFILIYAKNKIMLDLVGVAHDDEGYSNKDEYFEERGYYKLNQTLDYDSLGYVKSLDYPIEINGKVFYAGGSKEIYLKRQSGQHRRADWGWRWSKDLYEFGYKNGFISVKYGGQRPRIYTKTYQNVKIEFDGSKYYIKQINRTKPLSTLEFTNNIYSNDNSKKSLDKIMEKGIFEYTKPTSLLLKLMELVNGKDIIVLDFFSGSRVIIMTEANSSVKSKVLKLLPKLKTEETDSLCVA